MSNSMSRFVSLCNAVDQRTVRERALILLTLLTLLIVGWNFLVLDPQLEQRKNVQSDLQQTKNEINQLNVEAEIIKQRATVDPDLANRQQIRQLREVIGEYDRKLEARLVNLLSPRQMSVLLQRILKKQQKLRLISMENLPPKPLLVGAENEEPPPGLYQHAMTMEMEGRYLDLLSYLKALEEMPQQVFWDLLEIETDQYPKARVRLQIHTLSLKKEWIGA